MSMFSTPKTSSNNSDGSPYNNIIWFEPIIPLRKKLYRCDKRFHLDHILEIYSIPVGIIGNVFLNGKDIKLNLISSINKNNFKSNVVTNSSMKLIGKTRRGGQSALRYSRNRDAKRKDNVDKVAIQILENFYDFDNNKPLIDILVLSGPSTLKAELSNVSEIKKYFNGMIRLHPIDHCNLRKVNEEYCGELIDQKDSRIDRVKDLIRTQPEMLIIGKKELIEHIELCNISEIYVNKEKRANHIREKLNHEAPVILINNSKFLDDLGGMVGVKFY